jgi:predicted nuclease with TOPRIM domain
MSSGFPDPHTARSRQDEGEHILVRYVEELAGPGDYWVSITDAARITRTSEAMARRWVSSGRLPTRSQPVGLNQRTRMVRASDLKKIRPIIDPTAAITDAVRKVDIPSIPRVQEHLLTEQQQLASQVSSLQEALGEMRSDLLQIAERHQQDATAVGEQLLAHQEELRRGLSAVQQHHDTLTAQLADQARLSEQRPAELAEQIRAGRRHIETVEGEMRRRLDDLAMHLTQQQQETESLRHRLTEQQAALQTQQEMITALLERHRREVEASLEQRACEQAQTITMLSAQVVRIEERLEQVAASAEALQTMMPDYEVRAEAQDRLIEALTGRLQEEVEARQALSESLVTLEGQYQELRRVAPSLAKRRKRSSAGQ